MTVKKKKKAGIGRNKVVRRSIAGVLLASSLFVAAIPEDRSGGATAANASATGSGPNYDNAESLPQNGDLAPGETSNNTDIGSVLAHGSNANDYYSYIVESVNGTPTLYWQFRYFIDNLNDMPDQAVLSGYNSTYSVDTLDLTNDLTMAYDHLSMSDYSSFDASVNSLSYSCDAPPSTTNQQSIFLDKYFSGDPEWTSWKADFETKKAQWQTEGHTGTPTLSAIGMSPFSTTGANMTSKLLYYCDTHTDGQGNSLQGYTLEAVNNAAGGQQYYRGPGLTGNYPADPQIYVFKKTSENAIGDTDSKGYKRVSKSVTAIANDTFKGTDKVNKIILGGTVAYIGDSAFENSFITGAQLDSVTYIGNRVFKNCQYLRNATMNSQTRNIGKEAFKGCNLLESISIPMGVKNIGFGAFADCPILHTVDMSANLGVNIGEYAFYNDIGLKTVNFPTQYTVGIGTAAFAIADGNGSGAAMTDFAFPIRITEYKGVDDSTYTGGFPTYTKDGNIGNTGSSRIGDFILSGRYGLKNVTFPENYGSENDEIIPGGTFHQCPDLEGIFFGKKGQETTYNSRVKYENGLFTDVTNEAIYVYGPRLYPGTMDPAAPRESTWNAVSSVADYVPYIYYYGSKEHYEIGIPPYRYELEVNESDKTATILNCELIESSDAAGIIASGGAELVIPDQIADYRITKLGSGSMDNIKDIIRKLTVSDHSIEEIDDGVFSDCDMLEEVDFGNCVTLVGNNAFSDNPKLKMVTMSPVIASVGDEAFADSPKLENVKWTEPADTSLMSHIGTDAFKTGGDYLYFEGIANDPSYMPFTYAMAPNTISDANSRRICYKQTAPYNFYIIHDDAADLNILIDYPHYRDLDAATIAAYENGTANNDQLEAINATKYLYIPEVVESIDTVSFFDEAPSNPNRMNWAYVSSKGTLDDMTGNSRQTSYARDIGTSYGGLFSGFSTEFQGNSRERLALIKEEGGSFELESDERGNDWIKLVELPGVKSIPDHCFDSCERLESVTISPACEEIGESAFAGCTSLTGIGTNGNNKYEFDNGILYETKDDGTLEINTCLTSRGADDREARRVGSDTDPKLANVTSINEGAFRDCKYLTKADLTDTSITSLPADCFNGANHLYNVTLPESIKTVGSRAFNDCEDPFTVVIPANAQINSDAFDKDNGEITIWTYRDCDVTAAYDPDGYNNITIEFLDERYTVTFLNDDLTEFYKVTVSANSDLYPPNKTGKTGDPVPLLFAHRGWVFKNWIGVADKITYVFLENINQNVDLIALFENPAISKAETISADAADLSDAASVSPNSANEVADLVAAYNKLMQDYDNLDEDTANGLGIAGDIKALKDIMDDLADELTTAGLMIDSDGTVHFDAADFANVTGQQLKDLAEAAAKIKKEADEIREKASEYSKTHDDDPSNDPVSPTAAPAVYSMKFYNDDLSVLAINEAEAGDYFEYPGAKKLPTSVLTPKWKFDHWQIMDSSQTDITSKGASSMLADQNKTALAVYSRYGAQGTPTPKPTSKGGSKSATPTTSSNSANGKTYNAIVENGAGSGSYAAGKVVTITAYSAPGGKVFDKWTTSNTDIGFSNNTSVSTTFIMPNHDVKVTATYKNASTSSNSANNARTTTSNTGSSNNNNSNNSNNSGNRNSSSDDSGKTEVRITTDTIDNNKKNLGSATVAGSTDNFVVKITDSAVASAAVEKALRDRYGEDFENVKYAAFDISLYDSTGNNLVANANDLAVTITMPIPDDLVSYAGNNKAGAVINGALEDKAATFTTIDGVPCIRFTATHFSPYTIFVDTANLVRGVSDLTPKTGDGIAPKWFLSGGLMSVSAVLFLWKDKKKPVKKRTR
ncbi:MAG: leucine-rich repeat protein [Lachnospiraceae bacterium]|nr:leucine-rich repeat protein [Lachnospiraceae bacterium]